ncbi:MAG: hypothetical protein KDD48_05985 [Bdellovibrionales bacterium]|nr:hypothetical protein [Bdellovibrionales bacterium]
MAQTLLPKLCVNNLKGQIMTEYLVIVTLLIMGTSGLLVVTKVFLTDLELDHKACVQSLRNPVP